jgi:hypothetical protein
MDEIIENHCFRRFNAFFRQEEKEPKAEKVEKLVPVRRKKYLKVDQ